MTAIDCWIEVPESGVLEQAAADAICGCDLWLCLETKGDRELVLRGWYFQGADEGFHLDSGALSGRRVTHYWVRDRQPPPPSKLDSYSGLW